MSVSATSATSSAANVVNYTKTTTRTPKQTLGSEDFMKLLAVQFQSQDPMKPMEDTAFIAQMAQFTSLQNSTDLNKEMALLRSDQQNLAANSMLGRTVTVSDAKGNPVIGQVQAILSTNSGPSLVIDGHEYSLSSVTRIENTNTTATADLPPAA